MPEFKFYIDRKVTVWERDTLEIYNTTEEEAIKVAKGVFNSDWGPLVDSKKVTCHSFGAIVKDTLIPINPEDNKGEATRELMLITDAGEDIILMDNSIPPIQNSHV